MLIGLIFKYYVLYPLKADLIHNARNETDTERSTFVVKEVRL